MCCLLGAAAGRPARRQSPGRAAGITYHRQGRQTNKLPGQGRDAGEEDQPASKPTKPAIQIKPACQQNCWPTNRPANKAASTPASQQANKSATQPSPLTKLTKPSRPASQQTSQQADRPTNQHATHNCVEDDQPASGIISHSCRQPTLTNTIRTTAG